MSKVRELNDAFRTGKAGHSGRLMLTSGARDAVATWPLGQIGLYGAVQQFNAGGNLVLRVNKGGICVMDVTAANTGHTFTSKELVNMGALTLPVIRDLKNPDVLGMLKA